MPIKTVCFDPLFAIATFSAEIEPRSTTADRQSFQFLSGGSQLNFWQQKQVDLNSPVPTVAVYYGPCNALLCCWLTHKERTLSCRSRFGLKRFKR